MSTIPIETLRALLSYNRRTGVLTWTRSGKEAGSVNDGGYRVLKIEIDGRRVQIAAHKAIYAMVAGRYHDGEVDHRDTNRLNNRWRNLRPSTRTLNMGNTRRRGKLPKGVTASSSRAKPFMARIRVAGERVYLGCFACKRQAHEAYKAKAAEVFGEFARAK